MRTTITRIAFTMFFALILTYTYAQAPKAFNYQAVARDGSGNVLDNQTVAIRVSLHMTSATGLVVYTETHSPTTNDFGLFTLSIGLGNVVTGEFDTIAWNRNQYWLQVEMDPTGGATYTDMGTSQLLSVPYAMSAQYLSDTNMWRRNGNEIYYKHGNVGLGTDNPEQKLDLSQGDTPTIRLQQDGTSWPAYKWDIAANESNFFIRDVTAATLPFKVLPGATTNTFTVATGTHVGINTTSPSAMLHIKGNSNGWTDGVRLEDDGTTEFGDILCGQEGLFYYSQSAGNDHIFLTNSNNAVATAPLTIKDNGNVGVGTGTPANKFEVVQAGTSKFYVGDVSGIGYGFGQDYSSSFASYYLGNGGSYWHFCYAATPAGTLTKKITIDGGSDVFRPYTNNTVSLGNSSYKWTAVYATNGTIQTSDARYKTNISDISYGLKDIMKLRPVSYSWKNDKLNIGTGVNLGFVAQELENIVPDVVVHTQTEIDKETHQPASEFSDVYGVKYSELIPVLVKAIQEQQAEIEQLKERIKVLEQK